MTRRFACTLAMTAGLFGAESNKRPASICTTERVDFAPGGTIRIDGSFGYLTIEGWDEPVVQVTVTRSTDQLYESRQKDESQRRLGLIKVVAERRSETELAITTSRGHKPHVSVDYRILAPRDSQLVIHHDTGYVWVDEMMGGIEAHSHTGDMTLLLPMAARYSIDARTRMGDVASDFEGIDKSEFLVGTRFRNAMEEPSRRLFLRMGRGKITIRQAGPRVSTEVN